MKKVLLVEDHPDQRDIMSMMLQLHEYEVKEASNGEDALTKIKFWKPDVILMDLRMPRMDGYEAIHLLRGDPSTRDIPIITITAWGDKLTRQRALAAGADRHFTKPPNLEDLLRAMEECIAQSE